MLSPKRFLQMFIPYVQQLLTGQFSSLLKWLLYGGEDNPRFCQQRIETEVAKVFAAPGKLVKRG